MIRLTPEKEPCSAAETVPAAAAATPADDERRVVAIPVKTLGRAKSRLAEELPGALREALILSMLRDVVGACLASGLFGAVAVVTADATVAAVAAELGAQWLAEPRAEGLNAATRRAAEWAVRSGADALLILSGDVPLLHPDELLQLVDAGRRADVVIVPERGGAGTNALFLRPPDRLATRFGPDSRRHHRLAAATSGARWCELVLPGAGFDVDLPGDVRELARLLDGAEPAAGVFRRAAHTRACLLAYAGRLVGGDLRAQ
ncbi:MAG TPA: 2-phospho-L-lactate guanylyltransferase [Bacillota bacterium]